MTNPSSSFSTSTIQTSTRTEQDGEKYTIFTDRCIGKGAYSEVYLGRTKPGRIVAVKHASKRVEIKAMKNEVKILKMMQNVDNIVQYIGSVYKINGNDKEIGTIPIESFSFAMEYAQSSLEAAMKKPENLKGLPADMLIDLTVDCANALRALHKENIAHRDIKHMNILLFPGTPTNGRRSHNIFKLCDLGCAKTQSDEMNTLVGTPNMLHPCLAAAHAASSNSWKTKRAYTAEECDLWSLGCTLYYCATGKFPFEHDTKDTNLYNLGVQKLTQDPDAIGMTCIQRSTKLGYDFVPIEVLPARNTGYPKWLIHTMTFIIRRFFHEPSIEDYHQVAQELRKAKRRIFLSIDKLQIIDHSDVSNAQYLGIPSLSACLGYPAGTDLQLMSATKICFFEYRKKKLDELTDDFYLVSPIIGSVEIRAIPGKRLVYNELDDITAMKLAENRKLKIYDGLSMLKEADELKRLFDEIAKILSTQFSLLIDELSREERVQIMSRFAVYVETASIPMMMCDFGNSETQHVSEQCNQKANETRIELDRHMTVANDLANMAMDLKKQTEALILTDVDMPGIRDELDDYTSDNRDEILATTEYTQQLVQKCYERRCTLLRQIMEIDSTSGKSILKKALDLASSLTELRKKYRQLQGTISECVDVLETPFQEMKRIVNAQLHSSGFDRNAMQRSVRYQSVDYQKSQKQIKSSSRSTNALAKQLEKELEELGFTRMGDTLVEKEKKRDQGDEEDTLKNEQEEEEEVKKKEKVKKVKDVQKENGSARKKKVELHDDVCLECTSSSVPPNSDEYHTAKEIEENSKENHQIENEESDTSFECSNDNVEPQPETRSYFQAFRDVITRNNTYYY